MRGVNCCHAPPPFCPCGCSQHAWFFAAWRWLERGRAFWPLSCRTPATTRCCRAAARFDCSRVVDTAAADRLEIGAAFCCFDHSSRFASLSGLSRTVLPQIGTASYAALATAVALFVPGFQAWPVIAKVIKANKADLPDFHVVTNDNLKTSGIATNDWFSSKLNSVESRLEGKLNFVESRLEEKLTSVESRLEGKLSSVESKLEGKLSSVESKLLGKLDRLEGKLNLIMAVLAFLFVADACSRAPPAR